MKKPMNHRKRNAAILRWSRIVVQIIFFLIAPALFAQCFGGIKEIFAAFGQGQPIALSTFVVRLVVLCVLTIIFGRLFCGWACAFGAVGDWIYQFVHFVFGKMGVKLPTISERVLHYLQKLKYLICILILGLCFAGQAAIVTKYSPWTVFSLLTAGNFALAAYAAAILLLLLIVVGMILQERFFCQCLCPMGAVFSLLPEIPLLSMKRDQNNCIPNCQLCRKNCPVSIKVQENSIQEGECIRCGRCMQGCPKGNIRFRKK